MPISAKAKLTVGIRHCERKDSCMEKAMWKIDCFIIETHGDGRGYMLYCSQPAGGGRPGVSLSVFYSHWYKLVHSHTRAA